MDVVGLVSGGKDSVFNLLECARRGHRLLCLANLYPIQHDAALAGPDAASQELDSFMIQTVAYTALPALAECMGLPLVRRQTRGQSHHRGVEYPSSAGHTGDTVDEVEDLCALLEDVKSRFPSIRGVAVGAILSNYQRTRVENVCARLSLLPIAFVWQRDQRSLLQDMIDSHVHAVLVKVAAFGLHAGMLGRGIDELQRALHAANDRIGINVCGEGGEYESLVTACPLFTHGRILLDFPASAPGAPVRVINAGRDVAYLHINSVRVLPHEHACIDAALHAHQHQAARFNAAFLPPLYPPSAHEIAVAVDSRVVKPRILGLSHDGAGAPAADADACVAHILRTFSQQLQAHGGCLRDVACVHMYLSDMGSFAAVNDVYARFFGTQPPARAAVAVLPRMHGDVPTSPVRMDAIAAIGAVPRSSLHVRTLSSWAPLCIGPYAQANIVNDCIVFAAGQIAMQPETMALHAGTVRQQLQLALRNTARVLAAQQSALPCALCVLVYVSPSVRQEEWEALRDDACACVAGSPREHCEGSGAATLHAEEAARLSVASEHASCDCIAWDERSFPLGDAAHRAPAYLRDRDCDVDDDDDAAEAAIAVASNACVRSPVFIVPVEALPRNAAVEVDTVSVTTSIRMNDEECDVISPTQRLMFESHDADLGDSVIAHTTSHVLPHVAASVWTRVRVLCTPNDGVECMRTHGDVDSAALASHALMHMNHSRQRAELEWENVASIRLYVHEAVHTDVGVALEVIASLKKFLSSQAPGVEPAVTVIAVRGPIGAGGAAAPQCCASVDVHSLWLRPRCHHTC